MNYGRTRKTLSQILSWILIKLFNHFLCMQLWIQSNCCSFLGTLLISAQFFWLLGKSNRNNFSAGWNSIVTMHTRAFAFYFRRIGAMDSWTWADLDKPDQLTANGLCARVYSICMWTFHFGDENFVDGSISSKLELINGVLSLLPKKKTVLF